MAKTRTVTTTTEREFDDSGHCTKETVTTTETRDDE